MVLSVNRFVSHILEHLQLNSVEIQQTTYWVFSLPLFWSRKRKPEKKSSVELKCRKNSFESERERWQQNNYLYTYVGYAHTVRTVTWMLWFSPQFA